MNIYELRKTASSNKKYKYIYQLIIKGDVVATRRSNIDYIGVWIEGTGPGARYHWFKQTSSVSVVLAFGDDADAPALALTFDELVKYKNLSV
jgi:hypothetical protein